MSDTTITREHLELAALAAGMTPVRMDDDQSGILVAERSETWRPHLDIADAARLAVHIDALVRVLPLRVEAVVIRDRNLSVKSVPHDGAKSGKERAWCSAITLVAADIGRKMMEGGAA